MPSEKLSHMYFFLFHLDNDFIPEYSSTLFFLLNRVCFRNIPLESFFLKIFPSWLSLLQKSLGWGEKDLQGLDWKNIKTSGLAYRSQRQLLLRLQFASRPFGMVIFLLKKTNRSLLGDKFRQCVGWLDNGVGNQCISLPGWLLQWKEADF